MKTPISPVTKTHNTSLSETFLTNDIIGLYRQQLGIDVTSFFGGRPAFYLYRCNDTGYRFYYPENLLGNGQFYETLQNKLGNEYYHDWKFENQLAYDHLSKDDKVLDIGCGTGNFLLKAKNKTASVYGLELNETAVWACNRRGLHVYNQLISDHAEYNKETYDMVCAFQVLEHVYDVKDFLDDALKVLKKGGKMVIGVPNSKPYFLGYDKYCTLNLPPHHMGLWNERVFKKLCSLLNLTVLKIEYDVKGRILAEAYVRAKYISGVKSLPGHHTTMEKLKIGAVAAFTVPATFFKKITRGLEGSHMAVLIQKN
jgi:SAM-dependent methyltransferase